MSIKTYEKCQKLCKMRTRVVQADSQRMAKMGEKGNCVQLWHAVFSFYKEGRWASSRGAFCEICTTTWGFSSEDSHLCSTYTRGKIYYNIGRVEQDKTEIFDPGQNVRVGQNGKAGGTICHFEGDKMARASSQNGSMGVTILHPDNIRDNKEDNVDNKKDKSVYPSFCSARREGFFG